MSTTSFRRQSALLLLCVLPAFFASNNVAARISQGEVGPATLSFWRWTIAVAVLLPLVAGGLFRKAAHLRGELPHLLILGLIGMTVVSVTTYAGASTTTASNIGLIYAAAPAVILLVDWAVRGSKLSRFHLYGLALSICGIGFIVLRGDLSALLLARFSRGDLVICIGMLAWAIYSVLLKYWPSGLSVVQRTTVIAAAGALTSLPLALFEAGGEGIFLLSPVALILAVTVGVVAGAITVSGHAFITDILGTQTAVVLLYLIPLYNVLLAWLLLGESLQTYQAVGGAFVLAGITFAMRGDRLSAPSQGRSR